ncbi:MAG: sugar transferase [Scytolyngbya sp. HA4215-MV1]|nr:sugar transferase [Scytolyngbya sp. HA4215-MV1]
MKLTTMDGFLAPLGKPVIGLSLSGISHLDTYELTSDSLLYFRSWQKRFLDITGALTGVLLGFPMFLIVALVVRMIDRVPVLFSQQRFGLNGEAFTLYKLRTLRIIETRDMVDVNRIQVKPAYETTLTGKFWRTTSIDEIVQFWLVLKGDMSLIGHRPFPMYYIPHLDKIEGMNQHKLDHYLGIVRQYKPGMSSLSSINGRGDLTMQQKLEYDLIYAQNACFWYDVKILLHTLVVVILRKGAK